MSNPNPCRIPPEKQGHRHPTYQDGAMMSYSLDVPRWARERLRKIKAERVRKLILDFLTESDETIATPAETVSA
jgi:hypothetical protein